MKRFLCICLTLVLICSLLPNITLAAVSGSGSFVGKERLVTDSRLTAKASSNIPLKDGRYERWIDRLADLPDYARGYYNWLAQNANAQGALADPALAEQESGNFYHTVTVHTQTLQLAATTSNYDTVASEAVQSDSKKAFDRIVEYLSAVYDAFDRDHPEVFWLNGIATYGYSCSYSLSYSAGKVTVRYEMPVCFYLKTQSFDIRYEEYRTPEAVAEGIALRDKTVDDILSRCPSTGIADQLRYLNRVLTERNAYNSAVAMGNPGAAEDSAWECINALVGSSGLTGPVCEGYSRAFMVLCRQLGIHCVLVDGPARTAVNDVPEDHMWNYVRLEDQWYAVDVTWNDPYTSRKPLDKVSGYESENWLLLGSNSEAARQLTFIQSHPEDNRGSDGNLMFTNGPLLSKNAYTPGLVNSKVQVSVQNPGDSGKVIRLALYLPGSRVPFVQKTFTGSEVNYSFDKLAAGNYHLVISKNGYATMDCTVSTRGNNKLPSLALLGDIHMDGSLHIGDVAELYAYTRGTCSITDSYHLRIADVNLDGQVNIGDVAMAYAMVRA